MELIRITEEFDVYAVRTLIERDKQILNLDEQLHRHNLELEKNNIQLESLKATMRGKDDELMNCKKRRIIE